MKYHEYVLLSAMESCPRGRRSMIGNHVGGKHCLRVRIPYSRFIFTNWPVGQAVKTPPFHGGNTEFEVPYGSFILIVTFLFGGLAQLGRAPALQAGVSVRSR